MSFGVTDLLGNLRSSRETFLKHLKSLRDDQWTWKPYPECKSIVETLAHLISNDRAALQSLETGREPDYASLQEPEHDPKRLLEMMDEARSRLIACIEQKFA
ncbi:MAG: DinB family protein, partial [Armatimonadota bacterium]